MSSTVYDKFKSFMFNTVFAATDEIQRLIPDSILFGSLLMYFLTNNTSFGIFAVFIFEMIVSHKLISWVFSQTSGDSRSLPLNCRQGFRTPRFDVERMIQQYTYPSFSVFSIVSIGTYLGMAMKSFEDTLKAMGAEWESRHTVSIIFILALVSLVVLLRYFRGCESFSEIMIAIILGIVSGLLLYVLNSSIFGKDAMNFLGLPFLVEKDKEGSPIYVCSSEDHDNKQNA